MRWAIRARTVLSLGVGNIGRVALYRIGVKTGIHPVRKLKARLPSAPFFAMPPLAKTDLPPSRAWWDEARYFGWWPYPVSGSPAGSPPDWHVNPMTSKRMPNPDRDWWSIPDFDPDVGDIKAIWEASRFDWTLAFAQRAAAGDASALTRLNQWLGDWCGKNPAYQGPNWKCGQEASIRVMHLAMAAVILGQARKTHANLLDLIETHLARIIPTLSYAMAQDNNHGTSEAAAVFIGGSWLAGQGRKPAVAWEALGRRCLEERVLRLVEPDGSFSQRSANYHRVMLDTLSMAEVWRRHLDRPAFSPAWQGRARAACDWLVALVDPASGNVPNLGNNDGARLLPLTDTDYGDFRPAVQMAAALFSGRRALAADGPWNQALGWLGLAVPEAAGQCLESRLYPAGGYAILRNQKAMALFCCPRFRFRPSHADALHVDLWVDGENHLRDAGTYAYNTEPEWSAYFPGTASHNTVQFDDRDQMPRLGRFLFGDWLKVKVTGPLTESTDGVGIGAEYQDGRGAEHARALVLRKDRLTVTDELSGSFRKAILRWRLKPGLWKVEGRSARSGSNTLSIKATMPIARMGIVKGWESRHYLHMEESPVLEVEVSASGTLTSEYSWQP